jgi:hypothetical protein
MVITGVQYFVQVERKQRGLTSVLNGGGWSTPSSGGFTLGDRDPVLTVKEAGWASILVWTGAKSLAPTGIQFPDFNGRKCKGFIATLTAACKLLKKGKSLVKESKISLGERNDQQHGKTTAFWKVSIYVLDGLRTACIFDEKPPCRKKGNNHVCAVNKFIRIL